MAEHFGRGIWLLNGFDEQFYRLLRANDKIHGFAMNWPWTTSVSPIKSKLSTRRERQKPTCGEPGNPRDLYASHFSFVWRNLRRLGVVESLAEDAAQDVFLVVHRRWDSYDARWSSVETWLFGILLRVASDYRRASRRRSGRIDPNADAEQVMERVGAPQNLPDEQAMTRQAALILETVLDRLNPKKRALLVMVDIEEMTVPEAAEVLALNVNTAYWRLRKARTEFERELARHAALSRFAESYSGEAT